MGGRWFLGNKPCLLSTFSKKECYHIIIISFFSRVGKCGMASKDDLLNEDILRQGFLIKRSQNKKRFSTSNNSYKQRWFVLTTRHLIYYDTDSEVSLKECLTGTFWFKQESLYKVSSDHNSYVYSLSLRSYNTHYIPSQGWANPKFIYLFLKLQMKYFLPL